MLRSSAAAADARFVWLRWYERPPIGSRLTSTNLLGSFRADVRDLMPHENLPWALPHVVSATRLLTLPPRTCALSSQLLLGSSQPLWASRETLCTLR